jgi:phosphoserine phosphatase
MGGDVPFEVALAARLELIKPSKKDFDDCLAASPPPLTDGTHVVEFDFLCYQVSAACAGIAELIETLHAKGKDVYLVSGGFRLVSPCLFGSL